MVWRKYWGTEMYTPVIEYSPVPDDQDSNQCTVEAVITHTPWETPKTYGLS